MTVAAGPEGGAGSGRPATLGARLRFALGSQESCSQGAGRLTQPTQPTQPTQVAAPPGDPRPSQHPDLGLAPEQRPGSGTDGAVVGSPLLAGAHADAEAAMQAVADLAGCLVD